MRRSVNAPVLNLRIDCLVIFSASGSPYKPINEMSESRALIALNTLRMVNDERLRFKASVNVALCAIRRFNLLMMYSSENKNDDILFHRVLMISTLRNKKSSCSVIMTSKGYVTIGNE